MKLVQCGWLLQMCKVYTLRLHVVDVDGELYMSVCACEYDDSDRLKFGFVAPRPPLVKGKSERFR